MRRRFIGGAVVVALLTLAGWYVSGPLGGASQYTITVTEQDGTVRQLPLVDGGDPTNPVNGSQSDSDPRTPPVHSGQFAVSWNELDAQKGTDTMYTDCMDRTVGMKWQDDVPRFKQAENDKIGTTLIVAILTTASDAQIRELARKEDSSVRDDTPIVRKDMGFVNTRGIENGGCEEFLDMRPQVRTSHGVLTFGQDGKPAGIKNDRGIFKTCYNGWRFVKAVGPKPTPPGGTTVVTTNTTTPQCEGPCTTTTTQPPGCTTPCKEQKIPGQDPGQQGKAGGNDNKNTDQGQGTFIPDEGMTRPPETPYRTEQPVVTPPPAPPTITPNPNPGPTQTVQPSTQPPNHGTVPTNPGAGDPCNPDFQDCP